MAVFLYTTVYTTQLNAGKRFFVFALVCEILKKKKTGQKQRKRTENNRFSVVFRPFGGEGGI